MTDALIEKFRQACLARGVCGIKTFGRSFRIFDDNRDRRLSYDEFLNGVRTYGISESELAEQEVQQLFRDFDKDGSGSLIFDEFLYYLRPPMSRTRLALVDKAFAKMDKTGDGVITVEDLTQCYNVTKHPKFISGEMTKKQVLLEFLHTFEGKGDTQGDGKVTKEEFISYYSGVSASIDQDVYFDYMMRNAWKL